MANLTDVISALSKDRSKYKLLKKEDKISNFFIVNRFLSKKYPEIANKFNVKTIDKDLALDLWFIFLKDEPSILKWIWSKTPKKDTLLPKKDNDLLIKYYNIHQQDLDFLLEHYKDDILDELKYLKKAI